MQVSREFALEELKTLRNHLSSWITLLDKPTVIDPEGNEVEAFPGGIPEGLSVIQIRGVPMEQMKAELAAIAGRLEVLVST